MYKEPDPNMGAFSMLEQKTLVPDQLMSLGDLLPVHQERKKKPTKEEMKKMAAAFMQQKALERASNSKEFQQRSYIMNKGAGK